MTAGGETTVHSVVSACAHNVIIANAAASSPLFMHDIQLPPKTNAFLTLNSQSQHRCAQRNADCMFVTIGVIISAQMGAREHHLSSKTG
jgi:hypothetical protein